MVSQFALPKAIRDATKRSDVQNVGLLTEFAQMAPRLALDLAKRLHGEGEDLRKIYKQTGWYYQDGKWLYSYGDQKMKIREDNPLLHPPQQPPAGRTSPWVGDPAKQYEQPRLPMRHDPGEELGYTTRGGAVEKRYPGAHPGSISPNTPDRPPAPAFAEPKADPNQLRFGDIEDTFDSSSTGMTRTNQGRNPTFSELFSHPNQEFYSPELGNIDTSMNYTYNPHQVDFEGSFNPLIGWNDPKNPAPFIPGDISRTDVRAQGVTGGVQLPWTAENVALHEVGGHGAQRLYDLPSGGNTGQTGMYMQGKDVVKDAAARQKDLGDMYKSEIARLLGEGAQDPAQAFKEIYPNYWSTRTNYNRVKDQMYASPTNANKFTQGGTSGFKAANSESEIGYLAEGGEAQARNLQGRAIDLSERIPMTGGEWRGTKLNEGDVYPLETYDIPPDLVRQGRPVEAIPGVGLKKDTSTTPSLGDYDWMLKAAPAIAATAGAGAVLGSGGQAQAAEGAAPKQDRLPAADGRVFYPYAGPPEGMGEHWSEVGKSAATGARNVLESTAGGTGDIMSALPESLKAALARAMLGATADPRILDMLPTTEAVSGWTDSWMPAGVQDYTRHESKDPGAAVAQQAVEWGFDPLDLFGAGALGKLGRFF